MGAVRMLVNCEVHFIKLLLNIYGVDILYLVCVSKFTPITGDSILYNKTLIY
jgi:hypothetical protein